MSAQISHLYEGVIFTATTNFVPWVATTNVIPPPPPYSLFGFPVIASPTSNFWQVFVISQSENVSSKRNEDI